MCMHLAMEDSRGPTLAVDCVIAADHVWSEGLCYSNRHSSGFGSLGKYYACTKLGSVFSVMLVGHSEGPYHQHCSGRHTTLFARGFECVHLLMY
jgi:hypothetical protein